MQYLSQHEAQIVRGLIDKLRGNAEAGTDAVIHAADLEFVLLALFTMLLASEHAGLVVEFPGLHG